MATKTTVITESNTTLGDDYVVNDSYIVNEKLTGVRILDSNQNQKPVYTGESSDSYIIENLDNTQVSIFDWARYQDIIVPANSVYSADDKLIEGAYATADTVTLKYYSLINETLEGCKLTKDGIVNSDGEVITSYYFKSYAGGRILNLDGFGNNFEYGNLQLHNEDGSILEQEGAQYTYVAKTNSFIDVNTPNDMMYIKKAGAGFNLYFNVLSSAEFNEEYDLGMLDYQTYDLEIKSASDNTKGVTLEQFINYSDLKNNILGEGKGYIEQIRVGDKLLTFDFATIKTNVQAYLDSLDEQGLTWNNGYQDLAYGTADNVLEYGTDDMKAAIKALYTYTLEDIPAQDVSGEYDVNIITDKLTVADSNTLNFNVGCGNKTITLGEGNYSTVLNFISDNREGYVSDYQIVSEDVETGAITIQRRTGTIKKVSNSGTVTFNSDYTTDKITITDYLTNGQGKVIFNADTLACYYEDDTTKNHVIETNGLLENIIRPLDLNNPTGIIFANTTISATGTFTGSWLSEYISIGKGNSNTDGGAGNDKIFATGYNDGDVKLIHGGAGDDYIMISGAKGKTTTTTAYGDEGADTFEIVGLYGQNAQITLKDTDSQDTLQHRIQADAEYTYARDGQDLLITQTSGTNVQTTKIEGHFNKLEEGTQLDKFYIVDAKGNIQQDLSLLENATIDVTLTNDESYRTTDYKELISGTGKVSGLSDNDTVYFAQDVGYKKNNNDLIISNETSSITIENYFVNGNQNGKIAIGESDAISLKALTDDDASLRPISAVKSANKKGVVTGSANADTIVGSSKNNTINGGGGNDIIYTFAGNNIVNTQSKAGDIATVYSGIGNDTLNAGFGTDTYYFGHGHGSDVVVGNASAEKTILMFEEGDELSFSENGKNIVITQKYEIAPNTGLYVTEYVTLKDFAKYGYQNVYISNLDNDPISLRNYLSDINNNQIFTIGNSKAKKNQTVSGTFLNEIIYGGTKNDKIVVGGGIDAIIGGRGNDKLYGNANGQKVFQFSKKDGADKVYNSKAADTIKFTDVNNGSLKCTKSGNNLVITYNTYKQKVTTSASPIDALFGSKSKTIQKTMTDKITLVNYFKLSEDDALKNIEFADGTVINLQDELFRYSAKGKIKGTVYNDVITGSNQNDTYTLTQGGNDRITDKAGNDKYTIAAAEGKFTSISDKAGNDTYNISGKGNVYITDSNKKGKDNYNITLDDGAFHIVNDKGGKDTLTVKNVSQANVLFGFDVERVITTDENNVETVNYIMNNKNLFIMDKTKNGAVEVANFFTSFNDSDTNGTIDSFTYGTGRIENLKYSDGAGFNFDAAKIDEIKSNIEAWFNSESHGDNYSSAADVFTKGNETDIQSLISAYAGEYTPV